MKLHNKKAYSAQHMPTCTMSWRAGIVLLIAVAPVNADIQTTSTLRQLALDFLHEKTAARSNRDIEVTVGRIDRRLKLTACQKAPAPFLAAGAKLQGKLTVGLRCAGPKPWTVYLPAQIKVYANVISASEPLLRGNKISASDVMPVRQEISQMRSGYFLKTTAVVGKILKQNIATGNAISPNRIKAPILVHRGENVAIVVSVGLLKVRGKGEALRDAAQGELVSVRNSRSKRIIQGIVTKPGVVSIQM